MTFLEQQLTALSEDPANLELARDAGVQASADGFDELAEMLMEAEDEDDVEEALKAWPVDVAIHMTYETITPESAAEGEWADHGFYEPGGWYYSIADENFEALEAKVGRQKALEEMSPEPARFTRLDEVVDYMGDKGALIHSGTVRYECYTTLEEANFDVEGNEVRYSFHVEGPTYSQRAVYKGLNEAGLLLNYKPPRRMTHAQRRQSPKRNPKVSIAIRDDYGDEVREEVQGIRPRGVPTWLMVTQPPVAQRTSTGRVPPGGWTLTHVPTGFALMKGLSKADATLVARVVAREMPFIEYVDEVIADFSREPYRSAVALIKKMELLLTRKADVLREGVVPVIAELLKYDLLSQRELTRLSVPVIGELVQRGALSSRQLHALPPATQVALDAWLEARGLEELPE
jgi:hypothetical protein